MCKAIKLSDKVLQNMMQIKSVLQTLMFQDTTYCRQGGKNSLHRDKPGSSQLEINSKDTFFVNNALC